MRKRMIRFMVMLALFYMALNLYAYMIADRTIFQPPRATYQAGPQFLSFMTGDGLKLAAVHLPNPEARYTLLYSHGNAEDLGGVLPLLTVYQRQGYAVFAYDYRGYGLSEGQPSEAGTYRDIEAAYRYLIDTLGVPPERIIGYGRSLGGAMTIELAARQPLAGIITESAFTSAFNVLPITKILAFDRFPSLKKMAQVYCPILVIHGRQDEVIPFAHGEALFAAAPGPKRNLWLDQSHHNDVFRTGGAAYLQSLSDFSAFVEQSQAGQ